MEISNQVGLSKITPNISGNAYFSAKSMFVKNKDVADLLHKNHYHFAALPPDVFTNQENESIGQVPILIPHGDGFAFQFEQSLQPDFRFALIYTAPTLSDLQKRQENVFLQRIYLDESNRMLLPVLNSISQKYIAISFLDRFGKESKPQVFEIQANPITQIP